MSAKPKVAIIGAGLAGLTATFRLQQKNYDVTIYEARGRVGGRILTILMENSEGNLSTVEVGGQNITDGGQAENLLNLAEEVNLNIDVRKIDFRTLVAWDQQYVDFKDLIDQLDLKASQIDDYLDFYTSYSTSMKELIEKAFSSYPALKMALQTRLTAYEGCAVDVQSIYHNLDTLKFILKGGLSVAHAQLGHKQYQLTLKMIQGGNAKLPLKIAEELGQRIQLNKILSSVENKNQQIHLGFRDGTAAFCDKLILAVPAPIYQDISFDSSLLSPERLETFSKIGYGKNYKIMVPVNHRLNKSYRAIVTNNQVSFFNDDEKTLIMYCHDILSDFKQELQTVAKGYNMHNILFSNPQKIEDQQFKIYNKPLAYYWADDPYAKGSYAGYTTSLSEDLDTQIDYQGIAMKEIFTPVDNRLFFIGEHTTILEAIGTMEAAVESGERIAKIFL